MILLTEISKNGLSNQNSDLKVTSLQFALKISKLLYSLNNSLYKDIQAIYIFSTDKSINQNIFKEFNIDFSFYFKEKIEYANSLFLQFLNPEELNSLKPEKKERINRLISRAQFFNTLEEINASNSFLCYLPLININNPLLTSFQNLFMVADSIKVSNWSIGKQTTISALEYYEIKKVLDENVHNFQLEEWEEYTYKHAPFINQFGDDYFEKVRDITIGERVTNKAYFHGEDFLVARKTIDYYMTDSNYYKHDLRNGLNKISDKVDKIMFANIDYLDDNSLNEFSKKIWPLEIKSTKIAIQGLKIDLDFYLDNFYDVRIPDSDMIQNVLSKLFISLLIEKNKLKGDVRKLYQILKINGFKDLLININYISGLDKIINKIYIVEVEDLLYHPEFWVKFQIEASTLKSDISFTKEKIVSADIDHWQLNEKNGTWTIVKNGEVLISSHSNSFTYLAMILKYHETHEWESIHGNILQRAVQKFENKNYKQELLNSKPSGAWRVQKSYLKNKLNVNEIKDFIISHIDDQGDKILVIKKDEIKFDISTGKRINKKFFSDLNESPEA